MARKQKIILNLTVASFAIVMVSYNTAVKAQPSPFTQSFGDRNLSQNPYFLVDDVQRPMNGVVQVTSYFNDIRLFDIGTTIYIRMRACTTFSGVKNCTAYGNPLVIPDGPGNIINTGPQTFSVTSSFPPYRNIAAEHQYGYMTSKGIKWENAFQLGAQGYAVNVTLAFAP